MRDSRVGGVLDWTFVVCTEISSLSVTNSILSLCSSYDNALIIEAQYTEKDVLPSMTLPLYFDCATPASAGR